LHRSALWYARHGWYVVPLYEPRFDGNGECIGCACEVWKRNSRNYPNDFKCESPGKHPRLSSWEEQASRDPQQIQSWWQRWPSANIGIAAGKSGILAFDIDSYKDTYAGDKLLSMADEETITNLSGGGGQHLIYRVPDGSYYTNANSSLPDGIDIRCHGGQFVAPPSVHPSGNRYQWEAEYGPHEIEVQPLPDHIRGILDSHMALNTSPVEFGDAEVSKPNLRQWRLSQRILKLINEAPENGLRSENDQSVITALVMRGASSDQIRAVFEHYPIGQQGKFADKGRQALQYLAHSIGHAQGWCNEKQQEEIQQRTEAFFGVR
jgi:hypothetical protein